jgi:hypothetical protein
VTANYRNRIFNATNEKSCHGVKGPPSYLLGVGTGEEVFSFEVVFGVESGLFTFHLDSGQSTFHASFGGTFHASLAGCQIKQLPSS